MYVAQCNYKSMERNMKKKKSKSIQDFRNPQLEKMFITQFWYPISSPYHIGSSEIFVPMFPWEQIKVVEIIKDKYTRAISFCGKIQLKTVFSW